ncbi:MULTISPECIES: hypothetical protein [Pseudomonas]|uniref:Uncharacterized protein n=1 Tax=Pseudomonas gessardii TaxID=78544 RepID=A0ABS9F2I3_9PSED|nr:MULTISPECIES: hypothetical protein [Pseudomonas]MBH3425398.1 hypothetical protein [Pseudomonas gessardii]MCF4982345.1 hypothetical protein [Pseudomonas gessardii]MCF4993023.1 hypothetical protein [Pseudomonas gessardii]MCF5088147.1 hypothetical protein [Pseudomonas gessardii]MCF5098686.1 hypothetical protein [Pseudomonas gessardii]
MKFFSDLSRQLLHTGSKVQRDLDASIKDAIELEGDAEQFYKLLEHLFFTDLAFHEQGRANHMMVKTTFDSFQ